MSNLENHTPEHIEQAILGGLIAGMRDGHGVRTFDLVHGILRAEDFAGAGHRQIFEACERINLRGLDASLFAVAHELREMQLLNVVGGEPKLQQLIDCWLTNERIELHAYALRRGARARRIIADCERVARLGRAPVSTEDFLSRASQVLADALHEDASEARSQAVGEGIHDVVVEADQGIKREPLKCGIEAVDKLAVLNSNAFVVLGARPSVGKTALGTQIGVCVAAMNPNAPVLLLSLEMPSADIWSRLASAGTRIPHSRVRHRDLSRQEIEQVRRVAEEMRSVPFHCYSAGEGRRPPRIDEIVAFARAFKRRQRGLGMLIVDYLQIVRGGRGESMENRIADISATLKLLANELNCCVLALSQLNRDNEREGRRPTAADLRYSGAIEQDADAIALLHRPAQVPQSLSTDSRTDHEGVVIELLVVKNRHGSRGRSALFFREAITHFDEAPADIKPMNAKSPRYGGGRNVPASHEESDGERAE